MQRSSFLLALAISGVASAAAQGQAYDVGPFERIEADAGIRVIYRPAESTSARVEAEGNDYSDIRFETKGSTLVISRESTSRRGWFGLRNSSINVSDDGAVVRVNGRKVPAYTVHLAGPALSGADARRSARIEASGIQSAAFEATASSSGRLALSGQTSHAEFQASSGAGVDAGSLEAGTAKLEASSGASLIALLTGEGDNQATASSSARISWRSAAPANFSISASSGARIEAEGACASLMVTASSSATVKAADLACERVTANASSSGDVDAFARHSATAVASSGSRIELSGNPGEREIARSSGGNITFVN